MCVVKITRWGCRCEKREVVDCKAFGKRKDNAFWKLMVRARLLACQKTRYEVTPKKTACLSRDCPKRRKHTSKIPVVPLRKTARGTTGFLYSERREQRAPAAHPPAPTHHRVNANVEQQARQDRMRERRHDDRPVGHRQERPRAPPTGRPQGYQPREHRAGDLRRTDGRRLPKDLEGTRADPRTRHGERPKKVELPRMGNVAERRGVAVNVNPRVVSHYGVVVGEAVPRTHRAARQPTLHEPVPRRHHHHHETRMPPPPVPFKNHARRAPSPDVPLRPRAPVHGYEDRRRQHNPISRSPSPPRPQEKRRRSRIPEPLYARRQEAPIPAKIRIARENEIPRAQLIEMAFAQIPLNPMPNPIFANKKSPTRGAPKREKKKKGLFRRIFKVDGDSDTESDLSFQCVGLPQEQLAHPRKAHGEGTWWKHDLVMVPND